MTIDEATRSTKLCMDQMNSRYGSVVFDEWAILALQEQQARVLTYVGPRTEAFKHDFNKDLGSLRAGLADGDFQTGDFEFARHAVGTGIESFMVLGKGAYLICNNTQRTMSDIANNPKWLDAQVPFAELGDSFRGNPLVLT